MGKHVDGCWGSDVLMDNHLSSLDQVRSGNGIVFELCHWVTRNAIFHCPRPLCLDCVVDYAHSGGVVDVNRCRWLQVSKLLKDKSYYLCFLCVEKESSRFSFSSQCCNEFENGASDMDCAIDEYWLSVSWNATKEEVNCLHNCMPWGHWGRRHQSVHWGSCLKLYTWFLHRGISTCSQGIGWHVQGFLQLGHSVVWKYLIMPLEW